MRARLCKLSHDSRDLARARGASGAAQAISSRNGPSAAALSRSENMCVCVCASLKNVSCVLWFKTQRDKKMSTPTLDGEWLVARVEGTRIGTAEVVLDGTSSGRMRFHDLRSMLHTKFRLVPNPDQVLRCGVHNELAPSGRPLVITNATYEKDGTFWCIEESSKDRIVWAKTVEHVLDPNVGWMQSWDSKDAEMGPAGVLVWTRPQKSRPAKKQRRR